MNSYRMLGEQTGTAEARDLAVQLQTWHDAMVMHLRAADRRGAPCADECPHEAARVLWPMALDVFGPLADTLAFLRAHGGGAPRPTMEGRDARLGS